jgi:leucyl aminopeptidase
VGVLCWELPLCDTWDKCINSKFADMQNISSVPRAAGASEGGQFLQRFIKKETKWVHMDIAGVAHPKEAVGVLTSNASGFGIRLLDRMIAEGFEG